MVPLRFMEKQILHSDSILVRGCSGIIRIFCLPPCSKSLLEFCLRRIRISINWMISVLDNLRSIDFLMTSILVDIFVAEDCKLCPFSRGCSPETFKLDGKAVHMCSLKLLQACGQIFNHLFHSPHYHRRILYQTRSPLQKARTMEFSRGFVIVVVQSPPKTFRSTPRSHTLTYSQNRTFPKQAENPDPVRRNLCRSELRSTPALRRRAQLSTSVDAQPWSRGISLQLFVISSYDSNN